MIQFKGFEVSQSARRLGAPVSPVCDSLTVTSTIIPEFYLIFTIYSLIVAESRGRISNWPVKVSSLRSDVFRLKSSGRCAGRLILF